MKIVIEQPFVDFDGREWRRWHRYDVSDALGADLVRAGIADLVYAGLVADLAEAGAGLVITADTDPALIDEAKKAKLRTHKPRGK